MNITYTNTFVSGGVKLRFTSMKFDSVDAANKWYRTTTLRAVAIDSAGAKLDSVEEWNNCMTTFILLVCANFNIGDEVPLYCKSRYKKVPYKAPDKLRVFRDMPSEVRMKSAKAMPVGAS